jgi:hypothetical protein
MELRNRATGAVVTEQQFRSEHPNTSFPEVLTPYIIEGFGYDPVLEGPQATTTPPYQYSQRDGVEQIEGKWYTKYVLGPIFTGETAAADEAAYVAMKDAEFKAANAARAKQELLATDWSENASVRNAAVTPHLTNTADFDTYRLALRAIAIDPPATVCRFASRCPAAQAECSRRAPTLLGAAGHVAACHFAMSTATPTAM